MKLSENLRMAINTIALNKRRSFLTMLGIVVGLSVVMTIVSLGDTISSLLGDYVLESVGGNVVWAGAFSNSEEQGGQAIFPGDVIDELIDNSNGTIYDILRSGMQYEGEISTDKEHYSACAVSEISPGKEKSDKLRMIKGRFIDRNDCKNGYSTVVISDVAAKNCFGSINSALGNTVTIDGKDSEGNIFYNEYTVVGIYEYIDLKDEFSECNDKRTFSTVAYTPFSCSSLVSGYKPVSYDCNTVRVICTERETIYAAQDYMSEYVEKRIDEIGDAEDYDIMSMNILDEMNDINSMITIIIVVFILIAGISLIVGGIGLMNTMLVSVAERTKEIGIRKALGAKKNVIRAQFLTESAVICLISCAIGVFMGTLVGTLIEKNIDYFISMVDSAAIVYFLQNAEIHITPSVNAIVVSTLFSLAVGLIFGYYPANKGANMQPVDALRYE